MKRIFTFLTLVVLALLGTTSQAQTVYATKGSGNYMDITTWETYSTLTAAQAGAIGSGTAATSVPSGTHFVYIRPGHTISMSDANRNVKSIYIAAGAKLWNGTAGTDRRLQVGTGGTGFVYPLVDTLWVDGTLGGPNDPILVESGANAQQIKMFGSGTVDIKRIRTPGGNGSTTTGIMTFDIDINVNLWQAGNYALSILYNPTITDNYTLNIFSGKTVTIKDPTGTFHNVQTAATTDGNYTYNINGTLDFSASTGNNTLGAPTGTAPTGSKVALNITGGTMKVGGNFKADTVNQVGTFVSTGLLDLNVTNGGTVDATAASITGFNVNKTTTNGGPVVDLYFKTDATSTIKRTVSGVQAKFPLGIGTSNNSVLLLNQGAPDTYTASVKGTIDNAAPDPTKVVNRQWTINKTVPVGTLTQVALTWLATDQSAGFSPTGNVNILRWTGATYEAHPATVTGSGTTASPYVATASDFTAFSPFIVANLAAAPIYFEGHRAFQKGTGVQVEWKVAPLSNSDVYFVEKSIDGRSFTTATSIAVPRGSNQTDFSWFDAAPVAGNNYYRIRSKDDVGEVKYTPVMRVNLGRGIASITISPNPVENNILNIQLANLNPGNYALSMYNAAGQAVFSTVIRNEGMALSESIKLPSTVSPGIYTLQLTDGVMKEKKIISIK